MARFGRSFPVQRNVYRPDLGPVYFDNVSNSPYEATLSTYNWNHTVGTNTRRLLCVSVGIFAAGSVTAVDYGGVALTKLRSDTTGVYRSEIWYLLSPASGTGTITVTLNTSLTSIAGATSYWDVNQVTPFSANNGANGTNTPASASVTPASVNNRIFGGLAAQTASNVSDQIGQALRYRNQGTLGTNSTAEIGTVPGLTATTMQWNGIGAVDGWAVSLASIQPGPSNFTSSLSASLSFSGAFARITSKVLTGTLSFVGSISSRTISHTMTASLSFSGNLVKAITRTAMTATLSFSGAMTKRLSRSLSGTLSFSGNLSRVISRPLTATLSFVGAISRAVSHTLTGTLSFSGSLSRFTSYLLSGTLSFSGSLTKSTARTLTATLSFVGNLTTNLTHGGTLFTQALTASLSFSGNLARRNNKTLSGILSFSGSIVRLIGKPLTASLSFSGSIVRTTAKRLSAALSFIGNLTATKSGTVGTTSPFFILLTDGRTAIRLGNNLYMPL